MLVEYWKNLGATSGIGPRGKVGSYVSNLFTGPPVEPGLGILHRDAKFIRL